MDFALNPNTIRGPLNFLAPSFLSISPLSTPNPSPLVSPQHSPMVSPFSSPNPGPSQMDIDPDPLILPKSRTAQPLSIPSFRRVVSFVGREEGFELFDPTNDLELPSPKIMENIKYFFDAPHEEEHNHGALNFDCADVNNSVILGAIPQVENPDFPIPAPKPTMKTAVLKPTSQ